MNNQDVNFNLLLHLDYKSIMNMCQLNMTMYKIGHNQYFWKVKCYQDYGIMENDKSWKQMYQYHYLLNLNYNELLTLNTFVDIMDHDFWHAKYDKDFIDGNLIKNDTVSWKECYERTNNVSKEYPQLIYPFRAEDFGKLYNNGYLPVFKSLNINDFLQELTWSIEGDNWGLVVNSSKLIPLYNTYALRSRGKVQMIYENQIRKKLIYDLLPLMASLNVNDSLIIYMFGEYAWGKILRRIDNGYILQFYKSFKGTI